MYCMSIWESKEVRNGECKLWTYSVSGYHSNELPSVNTLHEGIVACRAVTMQRPRDNKYTRDVSRQRFGKNVFAAIDKNATMVQTQRKGVFYVVRAEMLQVGRFGATS
jgi:hypothetical protein